ncbi:MAG: hypothetical protein ACR2MA_06745 [Egibacteraceae bacterium]
MDNNPNDAMLNAVRDRLETFAQRLALDLHYERFPGVRLSLAEVAVAAARLDDSALAHAPDLLRRAAEEVAQLKPVADADDVLVYAAALQSGLDATVAQTAESAPHPAVSSPPTSTT